VARTAVLTPSLGRFNYVWSVVSNIEKATPEDHIQFWCVGERHYIEQLHELSRMYPGQIEWMDDSDDDDKRYVTRMNKMARLVRERGGYDYVFFGQDDVVYHDGWLSEAANAMIDDTRAVLVNDMRKPKGTQVLMATDYLPLAVFDDPESVFYSGYRHNFADDEQHETARLRGVLGEARRSKVEHMHPMLDGPSRRPWDETYARSQGNWEHDAALYERRMAQVRKAL